MEKKKQKNKKMTMDGLARLIKFESKKSQEEMAGMVKNALQGTQDLLVEKIDQLDSKFEGKFEEVNYKLDKIDKKLDSQEKTIFSHDQKIDRIEVDLKLKKA